METTNLIFSYNNSGLFSDSYTYITYNTIKNNSKILSYKIHPTRMSLDNSTISIDYFTDPTLGYTENSDVSTKTSVDGVFLTINISDCSGIYASSMAWNSNINGVLIDSVVRPDMSFEYGGDYKTFSDNILSNIGYWATGNNIDVSFTHNSRSILFGTATQTIKPIIYNYDLNGIFKMTLHLKMDFSSITDPYTFSDPNFYASGCILNIKMYDKNNIIKVAKTYKDITINPPDINGSISINDTKTVNDLTFIVNRETNNKSLNYTEFYNVKKHTYNMLKNSFYEEKYSDNLISLDNIIIQNSFLNRGDFCYISYEPKLYGIKPGVEGGVSNTNLITNCTGHKFSLSDVSLKMSVNGVYGSDILDEINQQNPYVFIDSINNSGHLQVTFNADHEDWMCNTVRDDLIDTSIYPYISRLYLIITPENYIENTLRSRVQTFTSYDNVVTYPNVEISYNTLTSILGISDIFYTELILAGTSISLISQSISVNILKSGNYKVYLAVVDEFTQVSFWCITNKIKNFNFIAGYNV